MKFGGGKYSSASPYEQSDTKYDRLEKMLEQQQSEIEFLRAKLTEVSVAAKSNLGTPPIHAPGGYPAVVAYQTGYPTYAPPPAVYYNSPPTYHHVAPSYQHGPPPPPPGAIRSYNETDARPSSAAAFVDRGFYDEEYSDRGRDYYETSNFRPASALDRWTESDREMSFQRSNDDWRPSRNAFEGGSRMRFPPSENSSFNDKSRMGATPREDTRFGGKSYANRGEFSRDFSPSQTNGRAPLLPLPTSNRSGQENAQWTGYHAQKPGRGNFRGSGFRNNRGRGGNGGNFGNNGPFAQARDSLGIVKDSGPRSSSPSDDYSSFESECKQKSNLQPRRVTIETTSTSSEQSVPSYTKIGNTLVPPQMPRKFKGLVDESFMSQRSEDKGPTTAAAHAPVPIVVVAKPEPRPPSSILKEMVDESFTSQNSNGNTGKIVTFKEDAEVAAIGRRSPFHSGEMTPSPTSSTSSGGATPLTITDLTPCDLSQPISQGQIVHVNSPYEFYIVVIAYPELTEALAEYGTNKKSKKIFDASKLAEGELCVVKFPEDDEWYRAGVTYPGKNPEVLLVDWGNTFTVPDPVQDYMRVFDSSLTKWPVQGACGQLAGVAPPGKGTQTWPEASVDELKRLVKDAVLSVEILDFEQVPPSVRLTREDNVDIAKSLIEDAMAKKA